MAELFKLHVDVRTKGTPKSTTHEVEVPALPPRAYLSHDALGFAGYVKSIDFWWDEKGVLRVTAQIEVTP